MTNWLAVALGGAVGACLRYSISLLMVRLFGTGFPFGTLLVNCVGSFCMGALYALSMTTNLSAGAKALLGVGLLGAFTTFSTFANESLLLMQEEQWLKGILNVLLNVFLCLGMVFLGQQVVASNS